MYEKIWMVLSFCIAVPVALYGLVWFLDKLYRSFPMIKFSISGKEIFIGRKALWKAIIKFEKERNAARAEISEAEEYKYKNETTKIIATTEMYIAVQLPNGGDIGAVAINEESHKKIFSYADYQWFLEIAKKDYEDKWGEGCKAWFITKEQYDSAFGNREEYMTEVKANKKECILIREGKEVMRTPTKKKEE